MVRVMDNARVLYISTRSYNGITWSPSVHNGITWSPRWHTWKSTIAYLEVHDGIPGSPWWGLISPVYVKNYLVRSVHLFLCEACQGDSASGAGSLGFITILFFWTVDEILRRDRCPLHYMVAHDLHKKVIRNVFLPIFNWLFSRMHAIAPWVVGMLASQYVGMSILTNIFEFLTFLNFLGYWGTEGY